MILFIVNLIIRKHPYFRQRGIYNHRSLFSDVTEVGKGQAGQSIPMISTQERCYHTQVCFLFILFIHYQVLWIGVEHLWSFTITRSHGNLANIENVKVVFTYLLEFLTIIIGLLFIILL